MTRKWREVRVFISSTFRDMHAERDHLIRVVFPELRERLERHRLHLVDIDLRWGVTAEQAENGMVLDLCLSEIDRCRPFFIGILGQRYGWIPHALPETVTAACRWLSGEASKSMTELEILHGVLRNPAMRQHAMFYLRQDDYLREVPPDIRDTVYTDAYGSKLRLLKHEIEAFCHAHDVPVRQYPCSWIQGATDFERDGAGRIVGLEQFGDLVRDDLWCAIALEYPEIHEPSTPAARPGTEDWLEEEQDLHDAFAELRAMAYVDRPEARRCLEDYLHGDETKPLLLTGPSGSGKSAVLADVCQRLQANSPDWFTLPHFVGASEASASYDRMLRRCCLSLRRQFNIMETVESNGDSSQKRLMAIPSEAWKLPEVLKRMLAEVPHEQRVLIILDAVDQLDEVFDCHAMNWLPYSLPKNVRIIVSATSGMDPREPGGVVAALRRKKTPEVMLGPLTEAEQLAMLTSIPSVSAKTLDAGQQALLLGNRATRSPLYLYVALEELRGFGAYDRLEDRIRELPAAPGDEGLTGLFQQVMARLEREADAAIAASVLALLASSRAGLSEQELVALTRDRLRREVSGTVQFMLRQLRSCMIRRKHLVSFAHRSLRSAAEARYLGTAAAREDYHRTMAAYFQSQCDSSADRTSAAFQHALFELPFHVASVGEWDQLIGDHAHPGMLTHLDFIEAKCSAGLAHDLERDYALIADMTARAAPDRSRELSQGPRFEAFATFVSTYRSHLERNPGDTYLMAYNWRPSGHVRDAARSRVESRQTPWIRRTHESAPNACGNGCSDRPAPGNARSISAASIRTDGAFAVSGREDGTLEVWRISDGTRIRMLAAEGGPPVTKSTFSPDGTFVLTYHNDSLVVKRWDLPSGEGRNVMTLGQTERPPTAFLLQSRYYVSPGAINDAGNIWVHDLVDDVCLHHFWGHEAGIGGIVCTADGRAIVAAGADGTLRLWDLATGTRIASYYWPSMLTAVAVDTDGRNFVCGSEDGVCHMLQLVNSREPGPAILEVPVAEDGHMPNSSNASGLTFERPTACPHCGASLRLPRSHRRLLATYANAATPIPGGQNFTLEDGSVLRMRGGPWQRLPTALFDDGRLVFTCRACGHPLRASIGFDPEPSDVCRVVRYTRQKTWAYTAIAAVPLLAGLLGAALLTQTRHVALGWTLLALAAPALLTTSLPIPGKMGKWMAFIATLFFAFAGLMLTQTNTVGVIAGTPLILVAMFTGAACLLTALGLYAQAKCLRCGRPWLVFRWQPALCRECRTAC